MRIQKSASVAICLGAAALTLIDILRASVGASSLIALSGLEIFAFFEFILLIILLLTGFWRLKSAGARYGSLLFIFVGWLGVAALSYEIVYRTGVSIAQHWDSEVSELLSLGHATGISGVEWDMGTAASKHCRLLDKKQLGMFPELLEYKFECDRQTRRVIVRLSLNHRSGTAKAYVKFDI